MQTFHPCLPWRGSGVRAFCQITEGRGAQIPFSPFQSIFCNSLVSVKIHACFVFVLEIKILNVLNQQLKSFQLLQIEDKQRSYMNLKINLGCYYSRRLTKTGFLMERKMHVWYCCAAENAKKCHFLITKKSVFYCDGIQKLSLSAKQGKERDPTANKLCLDKKILILFFTLIYGQKSRRYFEFFRNQPLF